jgi:YesN/AraC family two-component response regulator
MDIRILVVDDEPEICRTLKNYLSISGFNVVTAPDGETALEIAQREKIHIVLSDVMMPGMDGIELLETVKRQDFSTEVIIMTGFSTFDLTLKALEKGASDYIIKPFEDMEEIVRIIRFSADRLNRWKSNLARSATLKKKHRE